MTTHYANNKQALYEYEVLETYEAGLVLTGSEVKSVKGGNVSLKGSYASLDGRELVLKNAHIGKYQQGGPQIFYNPTRPRKLLLRRKELNIIAGKLNQAGLTIAPISMYSRNNKIKIELALVRGKKTRDKRESIKKRETNISLRRLLKR